ncbi:MAG: hypothetical protein R3F20_09605 [Planctomycetota bacterium]
MNRLVLALVLALLPLAAPGLSQVGPATRPAADIVRDYDREQGPAMSRDATDEGRAAFRAAHRRVAERRAALALELRRAHPGHAEVPRLMAGRWAAMTNVLDQAGETLAEISKLLAEEETSAALRAKAAAAAARAAMVHPGVSRDRRLRFARLSCRLAPAEELGPLALTEIARYETADPAEARALCEEVLAGWKDTRYAAPAARGYLKRLERVGKILDFDLPAVRGEGRVRSVGGERLVVLWSGFSERVLEELRTLEAARGRPGGPVVVGVHVWRQEGGAEELARRLAAAGLRFPVAYPEEELREPWSGPWGLSETPLFLRLDAEGRCLAISHRIGPLLAVRAAATEKGGEGRSR